MALQSPPNIVKVFTDRAKATRRVKGPRIRGETQMVHLETPFFRCRIDPANSRETRSLSRVERTVTHQMICDLVDETGKELVLDTEDTVTIWRWNDEELQPYDTFEIVSQVQRPRNLDRELLQYFFLSKLEER